MSDEKNPNSESNEGAALQGGNAGNGGGGGAAGTISIGKTSAVKKPTAGRTVLYKPAKDSHQGLDHEVSYPAIVVRAFSATCATLAVFSESAQHPLHIITSVVYNADGASNTWRWPELA